jgi:hypothetical protein
LATEMLLPIQAIVGDSAAWHHFAAWLARFLT